MRIMVKHLVFLFAFIICCGAFYINAASQDSSVNKDLHNRITSITGLVALWDFREEAGAVRKGKGKGEFDLLEAISPMPRLNEGPVSGYSTAFDGVNYLLMPNTKTGALNIFGDNRGVTVMAWVKWTGEQTGFVAGMWNEHEGGGKRQYGLFVSLPYYNGKDQVCGHISKTGKPTPPFPYSIDYSASPQQIPKNVWVCVAFTYDGENIKSFLNGKFESRSPELIDHTIGFEGYPNGLIQVKNPYRYPDGIGNNGSDFTIGAVSLKRGIGNLFKGLIGGVAVYDRALSEMEINFVANASSVRNDFLIGKWQGILDAVTQEKMSIEFKSENEIEIILNGMKMRGTYIKKDSINHIITTVTAGEADTRWIITPVDNNTFLFSNETDHQRLSKAQNEMPGKLAWGWNDPSGVLFHRD
jgi:Concanavalin A-like lectin/glucanases superfamily